LSSTLISYSNGGDLDVNIQEADFIHAAVDSLTGSLFGAPLQSYTHAILNPPYQKINSNSAHRHALRRVGIETVNLYSAFVSLAAALMAPGGQIVAIIPRSFCNGPYYKPFREVILEHCAIRRMHLFGSRNKAFKDDEVLQEHVIIHLECGAEQSAVMVSTSTDDTFDDLVLHEHPYERIVFPGDSEGFIHIPTSQKISCIELSSAARHTLEDIGLKVSTGPVVDFRLKSHLRDMPDSGTVPLLYP
jgi:adenine-specific DNA-methyltransferase